MTLAYSGSALTPAQLRSLADCMDDLGVLSVDLIPQISESRGRWFRLDGEACRLEGGRIVFEPDPESKRK